MGSILKKDMKGIRGRFLVKQPLIFQYFQTPTFISEIKDDENCSTLIMDFKTEKPLSMAEFEEKCPPGGGDSVILYTTSLRGIRKTFEDCNTVRFLLESFKVSYDERDVSMHLEFREELWRTLGGQVIPPSLFIKGRHIGGVDEVVSMHERGSLVQLLTGLPRNRSTGPCNGCGGVRFVLCLRCNGSRKVVSEERAGVISCVECNENGLVKCPVCR